MNKLHFVEKDEKTAREKKKDLRLYAKEKRAIVDNRDAKETCLIRRLYQAVFSKMEGAGTSLRFFIYLSFSREAPTDKLIESLLLDGHKVYCPKIENSEMTAVEYGEDFTLSEYGIREPVGEAYQGELDVIVLPVLAVDRLGNRLGYGGGYYDRYVKGKKAKRIAYCYECQVVKSVPFEEWDEQVDMIVTDENIYKIEKRFGE